MNDILLTISQALQLVAIAPCLFVIAFLFFRGGRRGENILPSLYFASLCCTFTLPLLNLFPSFAHHLWIRGAVLFGSSTTVPFSFLLVLQFLDGRLPRAPYWLILALPLVGGAPLTYVTLSANEVCLDAVNCFPTASLLTLYNVFSTALILLLLTYKLSNAEARIAIDETERSHKYWLIIALVMLNLALAMLDLGQLAGKLDADRVLLASTLIRITFIYLVLTSIFAVFYELFEAEAPGSGAQSPARTQEQDKQLVEKIRQMMEVECLYREMGLTRKMLAERLSVSEHQASRIINAYFKKNFNELVNTHRIDEAKVRLAGEETAITVIAFEVGFNSIASFNRVFRELVGAAPSEYRIVAKKNSAETPTSSSAPQPAPKAAQGSAH